MIKRQDLSESRKIVQMEYDSLKKYLPIYLDVLVKRPGNMGSVMNSATRILGCAFDLGVEKDKIIDLLTIIKEFGKANFMSILKSSNTKEITFQNKKYPFEYYDEKPNYCDPSSWRNLLFTSIILRDKTTTLFLNKISSEVHYLGGVGTNVSYHKEVELLKSFFNNGKFSNDIFNSYFEEVDKSSLDEYDYTYITKCIKPFLILLKNISDNEEKFFNKNLETALLLHKEFWSSNVGDRFYDSKGWVSLPILAISSLAFDKGINVTIESEYAPLWLIKNDFKIKK